MGGIGRPSDKHTFKVAFHALSWERNPEKTNVTQEQMLSKISIDRALLEANSHGKKGEIEEAKKLYQSVLQAFRRIFVRSRV